MHIGLIGGIGPAATELYYRGLVARHARAGRRMDLTIVHAEARELADNNAKGDAQTQAQIFLRLVQRLAAAGADAAAVTSIGGHFCIAELEAVSPLPILNAIPAISAEVARRGMKTVGLIGTRRVMETRLYGGLSSTNVVVPGGDALRHVGQTYIDMAVSGVVSAEQRRDLFAAGRQLVDEQGAEVVLLAGTDLFLAFDGHDCGFPTSDCAEIHMDALASASMTGVI